MTVATSEHPHSPHQHPHQVHHSYPHQQASQAHHSMTRETSREHERDVHGLRLALGSILSPKRLSTPSSRASSGTASPCPAHFGPGLVHAYHHGPSHLHTPVDPQDESQSLGQPRSPQDGPSTDESGHLAVPQPKRPAMLNRASSSHYSQEQATSLQHEHELENESAAPPILTTSNVHALSPSQAQSVKEAQSGSSSTGDATTLKRSSKERDGKENAHAYGVSAYIATLQSKRAWDALVHGNMS
ncbi:uncharacterized protein FOMMEDRAFT_18521 [Fomitiporia mediterranea MF3/22]|uniref:uncharacterized protein n=1 Tax=Fomitiporia mediterranea (strain MF3/22) TaxID=694068 RepID=UPI0004407B8E|nr:uncharacterized protein FOMMEDRAFT_18521 [Fomitiporia mediterranea MF3/22]EJD04775.1 hypothetical protein FOMMEDRAFT_18521 [Fomitiporia mediterranea MF3/22]